MIALGVLLLQLAAPAGAPTVQPASPRTLSGRFACDATVYEVQVTATPVGGSGGGQIIAQGTPEQVVGEKGSHTGTFLKKML